MKKIIDSTRNIWMGKLIGKLFSMIELWTMGFYHDKKKIKFLKNIIKEDSPLLLKPSEIFMIYSLAKNQRSVEGDYVEVGVFKGVTAKAICDVKGDKKLYLFDTFEGLPEVDKMDSMFKKGMFSASYEHVKKKLSEYNNVFVYKGMFPQDTGDIVKNKRFSFVHLDVDIYESTKNCLEFFYFKMPSDGILISHDYHAEGVKRAFDDFFKDKPENIIELPMSQCMIIKK